PELAFCKIAIKSTAGPLSDQVVARGGGRVKGANSAMPQLLRLSRRHSCMVHWGVALARLATIASRALASARSARGAIRLVVVQEHRRKGISAPSIGGRRVPGIKTSLSRTSST